VTPPREITLAELADIELHAIVRAEELLIEWEHDNADAVHAACAYAVLALATGNRLERRAKQTSGVRRRRPTNPGLR